MPADCPGQRERLQAQAVQRAVRRNEQAWGSNRGWRVSGALGSG